MEFFLVAHRYLRFVILVIGILAALRCLVSLGTRESMFMRLDQALSRVFSGALDLQLLAGAALVVTALSEARTVPWFHPIIMLPAVVVSHMSRRFRTRPDRERHRAQLGIYAGCLALIALGLLTIGQLKLI